MSKLSHLALAGILSTAWLSAEKPKSPKVQKVIASVEQNVSDLLELPPDTTYDSYGTNIYKMLQYLKTLPKESLQKELSHFPIASLLMARGKQLEAMKKSLEERYREINKRRKDPSLDEDDAEELRGDIEELNTDYTTFDTWETQQLYFEKEHENLCEPKGKSHQSNIQKREAAFRKTAKAISKRNDERLKRFQGWQDELDAPVSDITKA